MPSTILLFYSASLPSWQVFFAHLIYMPIPFSLKHYCTKGLIGCVVGTMLLCLTQKVKPMVTRILWLVTHFVFRMMRLMRVTNSVL